MKKLNRKGFTLIELLAVIVILAIVLVVTIPSVINAMNNAKHGQLQNAADTVAEWLNKQYELKKLGMDTDTEFNDWYNAMVFTTSAPKDVNMFKTIFGTKCPAYNASGITSGCKTTYKLSMLYGYVNPNSGFYNAENNNAYMPEKGTRLLEAAGISDSRSNIDYEARNFVKINDNDRFCVVLCAKEGGNFYDNSREDNYAISSGCKEYMDSLYYGSGLLGYCPSVSE